MRKRNQISDNEKSEKLLPKFGLQLLLILLPDDKKDVLIGDFIEFYHHKLESQSAIKARLWFWRQVMISFPAFIRFRTRMLAIMLKSNYKIAVRNLLGQVSYSILNLSGLAVGIGCFVVILLFVQDEHSFDKFHENSDRTYRLLDFRKVDGIGEESASAPIPLAQAMAMEYPNQINSIVRFFNFQAPTLALSYTPTEGNPQQFNEPNLFFVDESFFQVFDFELSLGDEKSALKGPNRIVLTKTMAQKYFGGKNPIGETMQFEDKHNLLVTGVLDELPRNTHLEFDFLVSFSTTDSPEVLREGLNKGWIWNPCWTYMVLNEGVSPQAMEAQFTDFVNKYFPESRRARVKLYLQPLEDIHLYSKLDYEMSTNSDVLYTRIFATIAVFILLISCFNFINLTTARATRRAREIGMRKVLGSSRVQLIGQFLAESVFLSLFSLLLSFPVILLLLRMLNDISGKELNIDLVLAPGAMFSLIGLAIFVGVISGSYPAFFLSSYKPLEALKGGRSANTSAGSVSLRKILVMGQFSLSVILILGTTVAIKQLDFLRNQGLRFEKEEIVLLPTLRAPIMHQYETFKNRLTQYDDILAMTTAEDIPGIKFQTGGYLPEGQTERQQFPRLIVHDDFASTMGIELVAGRGFAKEFSTDADEAVIINEAMVKLLGWESPLAAIGKSFDGETVIGVAKDFHFTSLHRSIGPFVLMRVSDDPESMAFSGRYIALRVSSDRLDQTLAFVKETWTDITPNRPFEYFFLKDLLKSQYASEARLSSVAGAFAILCILIACLGLLGLISFTTERRVKEIGIRKVLGASVGRLVFTLSGSFLKLVLMAIVLAYPIAYWITSNWLSGFAYRTEISVLPFISSGLIALLVVVLTVSFQTIKAARVNPVKSLRND